MKFEEWELFNATYPRTDDMQHVQEMLRSCWKAAQEDMRERAANVCEVIDKVPPIGYQDCGGNKVKGCSKSIRNLPIEV